MHPTEFIKNAEITKNTENTVPITLLRTLSRALLLPLVLPLGLPLALGACAADKPQGAGTIDAPTGTDDVEGADGNDGNDGTDDTDDTDAPPAPTWGYTGDTGPERWGALDPAWAACGEGEAQSPIDITAELITLGEGAGPVFSWGPTALVAANPGHTIAYAVDPGSTLRWGGATYGLVELHVHALSEHTVNGAHLEAELHFEHVDLADPGRSLVVAAFVVRYDDPIPDPVFGAEGALRFRAALALPEGASPAPLGGDIDLGEVFAGITTAGSVGYDGSLSTPPCTEGVPTFISDFSVMMAAGDLDALLDVYDFNYRPAQPLNGRTLAYFSPGGPG